MLKLFKKSKLFWIYFSTTLSNQMIPFLMLPILTKYLSVKDYGIITFFQTLLAFSTPIISMSLSRQLDKYFFKKNKNFIAVLIFQILILFIIMSFLLLMIIPFIQHFIKIDISKIWLYALIPISLSININLLITILFRNMKKTLLYSLFLISQTIINMGFSILLIIYFHYNYEGRFYGIMLSSLTATFWGLSFLYKNDYLKFKINKILLIKIWKRSLPMIPFGIATVIVTMSDIIFIKQMCSIETVGLYSVGLLFGKSIILLQSSISNVTEPWILKQISENNKKSIIKIIKFIKIYHLCIFFIIPFITYFSYFLIDIMVDKKFNGGKEFIFIIMIGYAIRGLQTIYTPFLIYKNKTNFMAINMLLIAITNIMLNYFFITLYGAIGAAYATAITFFISYLITLLYTNKIYFSKANIKMENY